MEKVLGLLLFTSWSKLYKKVLCKQDGLGILVFLREAENDIDKTHAVL